MVKKLNQLCRTHLCQNLYLKKIVDMRRKASFAAAYNNCLDLSSPKTFPAKAANVKYPATLPILARNYHNNKNNDAPQQLCCRCYEYTVSFCGDLQCSHLSAADLER